MVPRQRARRLVVDVSTLRPDGGEEQEGKEVREMEWTTPDFEEFETAAEVTAYVDHW